MRGISTRGRTALAGLAAACALLAMAVAAEAHDFWLIPDAFQVATGEYIRVRGQTSSAFPSSESAVALDRIADARLLSTSGSERITDISHHGKSLLLRHRPASPGQRVVAVMLHPRHVRESAAGFRRYLELEGAPEALARIDRERLLAGRDSVTRRYAKYAKTLVEVGQGGPRAFSRTAGHRLEFIPESDPAAVQPGESLTVRLFYAARPLPNVRVHAGVAPVAADSQTRDLHLTSDAEGRVRVPLARAGLWNVRAIHVTRVEGTAAATADWETHWATLVFLVRGEGAGSSARQAGGGADSARSDSAAVAAVVERFQRALATGDSATALALLASDAVILEAGGIETREEYRAHHLSGDIEYARSVQRERGPLRVVVRGDAAWVSSSSTSRGSFRGRAVNSAGAELMVLSREADGWRIRAIHWSSRARRPAP